tara:strand:+ start:278 stop:637 length:360 start_codon:yes stop_codon:yes gene_type:complete
MDMIYIVTGILFILLIIVESISEVLIRVSITDKPFGFIKDKSSQLLLGVIGYIFVALLFYLFLKYFRGSFAFANAMWQIGNIIIITLVSIFLFNTKLNYIQWLGFLFLIIGLILFGIEK